MQLPVLDDDGQRRFAPAPEKQAAASLWSQLPEDLDGREALFSQIQRVATWVNGAPAIGKRAQPIIARFDRSLPRIVERHESTDGSSRVLLDVSPGSSHARRPEDGDDGHQVECVHMPRAVKNPRVTFCISSQVGCAMGCTFCATGTMGIVRNLSAGEIVGEVLALMAALGPSSGHALNLVFMGMGEPLHNFDNVARAIEVLCHPMGVGMSPNRITVSTSGLVSGIEKLARLKVRPLLALSVNATTDDARSRIMPVNRAWNLARLKQTLAAFPFRRGEKVLLEYVLLRGENDTDADAARLAAFAAGLPHNVNVIPLNEHAATAHKAPDDDHVQRFARRLTELGCLCTVRNNRGRDVRGACGQLVVEA